MTEKKPEEARTDPGAALRADGQNAQVLLAHELMAVEQQDLEGPARDDVVLAHQAPTGRAATC